MRIYIFVSKKKKKVCKTMMNSINDENLELNLKKLGVKSTNHNLL